MKNVIVLTPYYLDYKHSLAKESEIILKANPNPKYSITFMQAHSTNAYEGRNIMIGGEKPTNKNNYKILPFDEFVLIDDDISYTPQQLYALLDHNLDICIGAYDFNSRGMGGNKLNVIHVADSPEMKASIKGQYKGLQPIIGGGLGMTKVSRKVFETIPPMWFWPKEKILNDVGDILGLPEDYSFFEKCIEYGFKVYCDYDVYPSHKKSIHKKEGAIMSQPQPQNKNQLPMNLDAEILDAVDKLGDSQKLFAQFARTYRVMTNEIAALNKKLEDANAEIIELKKPKELEPTTT